MQTSRSLNENAKNLREYYKGTLFLYNKFWKRGSLHMGFWEKGAKNLRQASENTNTQVAKLLEIDRNDRVLDAGCGTGGTLLSIAKKHEVIKNNIELVGINLSEDHIKQARADFERAGLGDAAVFDKMDFNQTIFIDGRFTKAYAIESACCNVDKMDFLNEMHRILEEGGRLVVVDGFLSKSEGKLNSSERRSYDIIKDCWAIPNFSYREDFMQMLKQAGFCSITCIDKTEEVMRSSRRIHNLGLVLKPLSYIAWKLGLASHKAYKQCIGMVEQINIMGKFMSYNIFIADMPGYE